MGMKGYRTSHKQVYSLDRARPEMRDFGRDQGVRKILPQAYS